jgi:hypothetical protein
MKTGLMKKITPIVVNSSAFRITYIASTSAAYAAECFFSHHRQLRFLA